MRTVGVGLLALLCLFFVYRADAGPAVGAGPLESVSTPRANLSPRIANYQIEAKLDTKANRVSGKMILKWRNASSREIDEVYFQLYANAWVNNESSRMNLGEPPESRQKMTDSDWSYIKINKLRLVGAMNGLNADLNRAASFVHPDDNNFKDRTLLKVPLGLVVEPGAEVELSIEFETQLSKPKPMILFGALPELYWLGRWYPQISVLDSSGQWHAHQHLSSEYFSDFGNYDVSLTVPSGWVVGATGRQVATVVNRDGTTQHVYRQEDVHAFAWTTGRSFTVHEKVFRQPGLKPVKMRLLLNPDNAGRSERFFRATEATLKVYGTNFGPYPYDQLTIVNSPSKSQLNGVEYPTIFTTGGHWLASARSLAVERPLLHEAGHQFWYGVVANSETEHAWLDEGINSYAAALTERLEYPAPLYTKFYFNRSLPITFPGVNRLYRYSSADGMGGAYSDLLLDKMSTPSFRQKTQAYWMTSYTKPALMMRTLENYLGWETLRRILSVYYARWSFKHPKPEDFFSVVNEISGQDLGWFFDQVWNDDVTFDYAVEGVTSTPVSKLSGYTDQSGKYRLTAGSAKPDTGFTSRIDIRRWGRGKFPIKVRIEFEKGDPIVQSWDGKASQKTFKLLSKHRVTKVIVDPEHVLVLDINYTNNSWLAEPPAEMAAMKWTTKWMVWFQNMLQAAAFFA